VSDTAAIRIGVLGAARIAPPAIIRPSRSVAGAEVTAIAARDKGRAERFAAKHGIAKVHATYADVVEDPDVDAVYIPLPNGLHAEWTLACLAAGKHVLCEKPFTSNAAEAELVAAEAARHPDLVVMEAFHWRYHPVAHRMKEIVESGELGVLRHVEASFCFPLPRFNDIRYQFELAGGALMDAGCYAVHMTRTLAGAEPTVTAAAAKLRDPDVDRAMDAELAFPDGVTGRARCSMWSSTLLRIEAKAVGSDGSLHVVNPLAPHMFHRMTVKAGGSKRRERFERTPTYDHQLRAFVTAVREGGPVLTDPTDSVATMRVIDAIYRTAGLRLRGDGGDPGAG
jgi:predicted dehydrogenase